MRKVLLDAIIYLFLLFAHCPIATIYVQYLSNSHTTFYSTISVDRIFVKKHLFPFWISKQYNTSRVYNIILQTNLYCLLYDFKNLIGVLIFLKIIYKSDSMNWKKKTKSVILEINVRLFIDKETIGIPNVNRLHKAQKFVKKKKIGIHNVYNGSFYHSRDNEQLVLYCMHSIVRGNENEKKKESTGAVRRSHL